MANGAYVHDGAVAGNLWALGTRLRVLETGRVFTVEDRIGSGSQLDIWMSSCDAAKQYGRRTVTVAVVT